MKLYKTTLILGFCSLMTTTFAIGEEASQVTSGLNSLARHAAVVWGQANSNPPITPAFGLPMLNMSSGGGGPFGPSFELTGCPLLDVGYDNRATLSKDELEICITAMEDQIEESRELRRIAVGERAKENQDFWLYQYSDQINSGDRNGFEIDRTIAAQEESEEELTSEM